MDREDAPPLESLMDPDNLDSGEPGSPPGADDDAPPAEPEPQKPSEPDEPPSDEPDAESEEWKSLAKKFENIEDEGERRRAIAKQYWEKTRYASQVRKENEELKQQLEEARQARLAEARREPPDDAEPPPPHPDLERLDSRINALAQKDEGLYKEQQQVLVNVSDVDQQIAVVKDRLNDADEYQRATLESRLESLEGRKAGLHDRFGDLKDRRDDLSFRLDDLQNQRDWTAQILERQGKDEARERQSKEDFKRDFPQQVAATIDSLADAAGLDPEDETLRDDLKQTVKDRLTVKFWKLGKEQEVDDVDVDELIESEVKRYLKSRDLAGRAKFGKQSREKLEVSGKRPASPTPKKSDAPPPREVRPPGYEAPPKDVTALGARDLGPTMERGRKHLEKFGL